MGRIKTHSLYRDNGTEIVSHDKEISHYSELCELIDNYPWEQEVKLFEELGEGGGMYFVQSEADDKYACYQYTPVEQERGLLDLDILAKSGFLGIFGRKAVFKSFDLVSIPDAKKQIKELLDYSVEALYDKYKK